MFLLLTLFTQVVWGYSALRGGLAYLPFVGAFIVVAGVCSKLVPRFGARIPMTIGALLAPPECSGYPVSVSTATT